MIDSSEDKKLIARMNEINVIATLAKSGNAPMYVSAIKNAWPEIRDVNTNELLKVTKQGVKAACQRLVEEDILDHEDKSAPKRRTKGTPHYWIMKNLDNLYRIDEKFGTYALNELRASPFGSDLLTEENILNYLAKQLAGGREGRLNVSMKDLESIAEMARASTRSLETFLRHAHVAHTLEEHRSYDPNKEVERLRVMMILEFLLDIFGKEELSKAGWDYDVEIRADLERGIKKIRLNTKLRSSAREG
jgi:hypothetical protein